MTNGHGGARANSGRKPGSMNARSRETVEKALSRGVSPIEVMLENMRFYHQGACELAEALLSGKPMDAAAAVGAAEEAQETPNATVIEAIGQVVGLRKLAGEEAARAAPYCHVRLAPASDGEAQGEGDVEIPLADRLKEYQRREDIAAAGNKVVELKR